MFKLYSDLLIEIETYKDNIKVDTKFRDKLIEELNPNAPSDMRGMQYDGMPRGSADFTPLDRLYERKKGTLEMIKQSIEGQTSRLEAKEIKKRKLEDAFKKCEGLSHKVFDMHRIQKKPLKEVAYILGYSYAYIKDINYKIQKEIMNDL